MAGVAGRAAAGDLWAVSCHFNPCRYGRRLANFRRFRERLGVPLLAVELSHDGEFELSPGDADHIVRLVAPDVMWQKERLLNLAIARLPASCETVAWLDADVVFERDDWAREAAGRLAHDALLQLFGDYVDLPPDALPEQGPFPSSGPSFAALHDEGGHEARLFDVLWSTRLTHTADGVVAKRGRASGFAWAARRDLLARHGLYDGCILGSGDRAIACAAYGRAATARQSWLVNDAQRRHYLRWAGPFSRAVAGRVVHLPGRLFHLWHGELVDRGYRDRWHDPVARGFDPARDIVIDDAGCWRWSSDKPELHDYVRSYFGARREDGPVRAISA